MSECYLPHESYKQAVSSVKNTYFDSLVCDYSATHMDLKRMILKCLMLLLYF